MSNHRFKARIGHIYPLRRRIGHIYPLKKLGEVIGGKSKVEDQSTEDR